MALAKNSNKSALKIFFTEFDWAVFDAVTSLRVDENDFTTAAIICRKLGASHTPTKVLQNAVLDSLEKFSMVRIVADMENSQFRRF